jgi:glycosyltransferase involved in cell wall biosynthesis
MHIITLGTTQQGGIDSVIKGYEQDGLYKNVTYTRLSSHTGKSKLKDLLAFIVAFFATLFILIKGKVDILHCHMSYNGSFWRKFTFMLLAKAFRVKSIIHLHGSEFKDFYARSTERKQKYIRYLINNVDEFIVLSDSWDDFIHSITGRKCTVINNYVDIVKTDTVRGSKQIVFLGALIKRKGVYDLIEACSQLTEDYTLHLCGSGEDEQVAELIKSKNLTDKVIMHGWIDSEQKRNLLSECNLFVLPTYNEGLPMVIIEAMACEIPILTTPVGAIPEVIIPSETGYLFTPGNIDGLVDSLTCALNADNQTLVNNAKLMYIDKFTSSVAFPKLKNLYGMH